MLEADFALKKKHFSLEIRLICRGITTLFGPSGAGKSTTLKVIAGLIDPDRGSVVLGERVLYDSSSGYSLPIEQRQLGCVFQEPYLFPHLSVAANLLYGYRRRKRTVIRYETIVDLLELGPLLATPPTTLSGGEKQRVAIGRALLRHPLLLLLDEPVNALDAVRQQKILTYLKRIQRELDLPILYISHALEDVLRLSDHLVVLREGRVLTSGPVSEVLSHARFYQTHGTLGSILRGKARRKLSSLLEVCVKGICLHIPDQGYDLSSGDEADLYIPASSVIVSRSDPERISLLNRISMTVREMEPIGDTDQARLCLEEGGVRLVSVISQASRERLELSIGQRVVALLTDITVLHPRLTFPLTMSYAFKSEG